MINKINTSKIKMSKRHSKRPKIDQQSLSTEAVNPLQRLPNKCKDSVRNHINSVYVGSIVRIYDTAYGSEGHLVTAHWITENGLFATVHEDCKMDFVSLKYKTWVVDQRQIKPGSFRLLTRFGTDDIEEETKVNTINEVKQKNSRVLMNNTLMDYPTQKDRQINVVCSVLHAIADSVKKLKNIYVQKETKRIKENIIMHVTTGMATHLNHATFLFGNMKLTMKVMLHVNVVCYVKKLI